MKLKDGWILHQNQDEYILATPDEKQLSGFVRTNATAGFILCLLKKETTREGILQAMREKYDAEDGKLAASLDYVLSTLTSVNALDD